MEKITNHLNDKELIIKRYKIRSVGKEKASIETTVPREVFEREARRHSMTVEQAIDNLVAVWRYDGFSGLYLSFEKGGSSSE
jgi:hypothetical protein